jgi:hypothetical protein
MLTNAKDDYFKLEAEHKRFKDALGAKDPEGLKRIQQDMHDQHRKVSIGERRKSNFLMDSAGYSFDIMAQPAKNVPLAGEAHLKTEG